MISSAKHAANLLSKWKADHVPVVVAFSIERLASFRFKGFITDVSWPIVRVADGYSNFVVDFTATTHFEHLEPHEASPNMRSLLETGFISLLRVVVPQGAIFFAELRPKDMTN
jgi:hypothetical protein